MVTTRTARAAALIVSAATGCVSVDGGTEAARERAVASVPETRAAWATVESAVVGEPVGWIAALGDPMLEALVAEAQQNNRDLAAAAANVDRSRALARQAGASLSPQVSAGVGSDSGGLVDGSGSSSYSAGVQASWEVDLWGRLRSGREGAVRSLEAAEADYRFSQYSIAAAVANAYFLAVEADKQLRLTASIIDALAETDRLTQVRFDNGIGNAQDVALSRSNLASSRNDLIEIEGARRDALRALELLLGRYPSADVEVSDELPAVPPAPPLGVPSELLERRPDLVAAERRIAAAIKGVDEARAARLPSLSLTGTLGGASDELSDVLDTGNLAWTAASSLLTPLIDGGFLKSQVDIAEAGVESAVAAYAQAALNAFSDVEGALDQEAVLRRREAELAVARDQAREALRLARLRYDEGETDLIDVLNIQNRVLGTESDLITVQRSQLSERLSLNLALGGSWQ